MREKYLERKVVTHCKKQGFMALKLVLFGAGGFPDRTILGNGRVLFLELKQKGARPTKLQKWWLARLRSLGFRAEWADDMETCETLIRETLITPSPCGCPMRSLENSDEEPRRRLVVSTTPSSKS